MRSAEWIFFDLDGTLIDHESAADVTAELNGAPDATMALVLPSSHGPVRYHDVIAGPS